MIEHKTEKWEGNNTPVSPTLSPYRTLIKLWRQQFLKNYSTEIKSIERGLLSKNIYSILISVEDFLKSWSSKFD